MGENKLVLLLVIVCLSVDGAVNITVPPVPVTAPIYTTAAFTCKGVGDILNWHVQSVVLNDSIAQQREITVTTTKNNNTNFSSVLTVNAIPINDGLGIGCEMISFFPFNRVMSGSVLTIRGISSVEDLEFIFTTNNSLLIRWSRPAYYSNDIPQGSPVNYQVLFTDEEQDVILDVSSTIIEMHLISQCDAFNISVTALVDQYISINNTVSNNGSLGYNATITTNEDNFLTPNVFIELSCPPSQSISSLNITSDSELIDQYIFTGTGEVVNDERTLAPSNEYKYTVHIYNLRNNLKYETYIIITTYQVIGLNINNTYTNGSVSVQCVFVSGSTADGCHVMFTNTISRMNECFNIVGSHDTIISISTSGNYSVTAYDIVKNGSFNGPAIEYSTLVEIVRVTLSTSSSSSITSESTTALPHSTVIPTITVTPGTEATSPTSGTINDNTYIVPLMASIFSGIVLLICIILTIYAMLCVCLRKRKKRNKGDFRNQDLTKNLISPKV
uniref:Fibronectin type-III domain-containing protein n=1 Tax=Amphimedon queenslandica TaxID=400682 RepID=A0A1X7V0G5_AMPQE